MSALASTLPDPTDVPRGGKKPGPTGACVIYGPGDKEDWTAVDSLRHTHDWATAHQIVHKQLGLPEAIPDSDRFRYHWRGKCGCWTPELKAWIRGQS